MSVPFCPDSKRVLVELPWSSAPPTEWTEPVVDGLRELTEPCLLLLTRNQSLDFLASVLMSIPVEGEFVSMRQRRGGRSETVDGLPGCGIRIHGDHEESRIATLCALSTQFSEVSENRSRRGYRWKDEGREIIAGAVVLKRVVDEETDTVEEDRSQ